MNCSSKATRICPTIRQGNLLNMSIKGMVTRPLLSHLACWAQPFINTVICGDKSTDWSRCGIVNTLGLGNGWHQFVCFYFNCIEICPRGPIKNAPVNLTIMAYSRIDDGKVYWRICANRSGWVSWNQAVRCLPYKQIFTNSALGIWQQKSNINCIKTRCVIIHRHINFESGLAKLLLKFICNYNTRGTTAVIK